MKNTFLFIFFYLLFSSAQAQRAITNQQFYLNGKIIDQLNGVVSLLYFDNKGKEIKDSCVLNNGNFFFEGHISEPTLAALKGAIKSISDDDPNSTHFYLEPGKMTAVLEKDHFNKMKILGSKTQKEFEMLQTKYDNIDITSDSAYEKFSKVNYKFVATHPDSYVSAFQLALYETRWPLDSVRQLYNQFNPKIQKSFYGKEVAESVNDVDSNSPGRIAKSFTAKDIIGNSINLSDFKCKYVLLDFWASWCVPCRQGNPHLIELFKKYHHRGLNIIGISDDDNIEAWKTAVKKDKVGIWYNILSELKMNINTGKIGVSQSISKEFGIHVLPTKILIDKNGVIIGRYKGTEDEPGLDKKLSEIFN